MTGFFERKKRAKNAQLTVRLDEQLKKRAELRLEAMGMTATEAVEQLYRFIADHGRMPVTERIVTFDIQSQRGRAIALNPALEDFLGFVAGRNLELFRFGLRQDVGLSLAPLLARIVLGQARIVAVECDRQQIARHQPHTPPAATRAAGRFAFGFGASFTVSAISPNASAPCDAQSCRGWADSWPSLSTHSLR